MHTRTHTQTYNEKNGNELTTQHNTEEDIRMVANDCLLYVYKQEGLERFLEGEMAAAKGGTDNNWRDYLIII